MKNELSFNYFSYFCPMAFILHRCVPWAESNKNYVGIYIILSGGRYLPVVPIDSSAEHYQVIGPVD